MPRACEPLAHAPLTVKLIPRNLNITERFMLMVEFMDWKIEPDPRSVVSFFSRIRSMASITGTEELSLP